MITQKQIAHRLGVSQSAVACAFHPTLHRNVSPPKRSRILMAAKELGYEPHHAARRLVRRRFAPKTKQFDQAGLIYFAGQERSLDSVCLEIIFGAEGELSKHRASFVFINAGLPGGWDKVDRAAHASEVDGWLVYGPITDEILSRLRRHNLPIVIVGEHHCTQPVHSVQIDNVAVGRMAAEYLASCGHRHVAYLAGGMDFRYPFEMQAGFRAARTDSGLNLDENLMVKLGDWYGSRLHSWMSDRRNQASFPTALFTSEAGFANSVIEMLRETGIRVPDDISVLGCELGGLNPAKTDVTQIEWLATDIGREGIALLQMLALDPTTPLRNVLIAPRLAAGSTVRSLAAENLNSSAEIFGNKSNGDRGHD